MKIGKLIIEFHSPVTFKIQPDWMKEVKEALRNGRKLLAVKLYKDATGVGLKEAKDYVYDNLVPKYYVEPKPLDSDYTIHESHCTIRNQ